MRRIFFAAIMMSCLLANFCPAAKPKHKSAENAAGAAAPLAPSQAIDGSGPADSAAIASMPAPTGSPFLTVLPELQNATAPDWVKPAVRLTYYSASATVAGAQNQFTQDPNGDWIDPATGQRYSESQVGTSAGEGYSEVNIAADDGKQVALDIRSYGYDPNHKTLWAIGSMGGICAVGAGSDYWMNPDELKKLADAPPANLKIGRIPYKLKNKQYDAIWIQSGAGENYLAWIYDAKSGVLLHSAGSSRGANQQIQAQGEGPRQGNLLLTENTLVQQRVLQLPWADDPAPSWIAKTRQLDYEGANAYTTPGVLPLKLPISKRMQFESHGANWITCSQISVQKSLQGMPPQQSQVNRAFGGAEIGGLWVAPAVLAKLKPGELIDRDPITGIETSVSARPHGNVTITEIGGGLRTDSTYDHKSGVLISYTHTENTLHMTTEVVLNSRQ